MKNHQLLEVDLVHVREFNDRLGDALEDKPAEYLPLVRPSIQSTTYCATQWAGAAGGTGLKPLVSVSWA